MLTNFFGKSKPITILVILALFLYYFTIVLISNETSSFSVLPYFLLILAIISFINTKNELSFDNSYVFLFSVILIGLFPETFKINTVFYSNLTILLLLRKTYSFQSSKKIIKKLFDSGLWLGVSFLIEPFSITFIVLLYFSIFLHQDINFRTLLTPLIGFVTPIFLYFTYCFWHDQTVQFFLVFDWFTSYELKLFAPSNSITTYLIGFLIVVAVFIKTPRAFSVKNDFRKSWILVVLNFICAFALVILIKDKDGSEFLYIIFPAAIIIANAIEVYEKKWFTDIAIALTIAYSLVVPFF